MHVPKPPPLVGSQPGDVVLVSQDADRDPVGNTNCVKPYRYVALPIFSICSVSRTRKAQEKISQRGTRMHTHRVESA